MAELSICAEIDTRLNLLLDLFFCKILLRFIICDKTEYIMGEVSMSFRKKISLSVISAACVFAFVACGNNTSTPKCGDKDVQEKLAEILTSHMEDTPLSRDIGLEKIVKGTKFQNFITDEVNDTRKKVTCKAHVKFDINVAKEFMYLISRGELKDTLEFKSGEKLTEKNIEEIFIRTAEKNKISDNMSKAQKEKIINEAKKKAKEFKEEMSRGAEEIMAAEEKEIKYTAQRTDDGNLIVKEIEDYYE